MDKYLVSAKDIATGAQTSIQISRAGRLVGALVTLTLDSIVDNAENLLQLSLVSSPPEILAADQSQQLSQVLGVVWNQSNFATSGLTSGGTTLYVPMDEPVAVGQFLYAYHELLGTGSGNYAVVWFIKPGK